jgi:hypothetical protein
VRRSHPDVVVELEIDATDKVAHFANVPGLYRHWSLLARYRGHIDYRHHRDEVEGLCTFEYATGVGVHSVKSNTRLKLPAKFFTYQVLNLDDMTQALFVQSSGPGGSQFRRRSMFARSTITDRCIPAGSNSESQNTNPNPAVPPTVAACVCRGRWPGGCSTTTGRT